MKTIRHLREERGWSQGELARCLGVEQSTISTWERGRCPRLRYLLRLADLFGVSLADLVAAQAEQTPQHALERAETPEDGR